MEVTDGLTKWSIKPYYFGIFRKSFLHHNNVEEPFCLLKCKEFADNFI